MYLVMSSTIFNSFPKLMSYLVSKTLVLMSLKISSKVFSGNVICVVNWTSCLLVISWLIEFGKPAQFQWSGSLNSMGACDIESFVHFNGTLIGLIGCTITPTIDSTILVETTCIAS